MKTKAFTLIEMLVVMAIIAILAAILIPLIGRLSGSNYETGGNIQKLSVEQTFPQVYHWKNLDDGKCFNTGSTNDPSGFRNYEECRQ